MMQMVRVVPPQYGLNKKVLIISFVFVTHRIAVCFFCCGITWVSGSSPGMTKGGMIRK